MNQVGGLGLFSKDYVKAYKNAVMGLDVPKFTIFGYMGLIVLFLWVFQ